MRCVSAVSVLIAAKAERQSRDEMGRMPILARRARDVGGFAEQAAMRDADIRDETVMAGIAQAQRQFCFIQPRAGVFIGYGLRRLAEARADVDQ